MLKWVFVSLSSFSRIKNVRYYREDTKTSTISLMNKNNATNNTTNNYEDLQLLVSQQQGILNKINDCKCDNIFILLLEQNKLLKEINNKLTK
jgi:hypothetical protein